MTVKVIADQAVLATPAPEVPPTMVLVARLTEVPAVRVTPGRAAPPTMVLLARLTAVPAVRVTPGRVALATQAPGVQGSTAQLFAPANARTLGLGRSRKVTGCNQ